MRTFAVFLLLICALPCTAQQVTITDFCPTGEITWSNTVPPLYCGIEVKWNLQHTWIPTDVWDLYVSGSVTNASLHIDNFLNAVRNLCLALGCEQPDGLFYRILASSSPLASPSATNFVQLFNVSTSVLMNVEIGAVDSGHHNAITNFLTLAPQAVSSRIPVVWDIPIPDLVSSNTVNPIEPTIEDGWYVAYDHQGSNHVVESYAMPFGPPEKNISVTVSNESVSAFYEWLNFSGALP